MRHQVEARTSRLDALSLPKHAAYNCAPPVPEHCLDKT